MGRTIRRGMTAGERNSKQAPGCVAPPELWVPRSRDDTPVVNRAGAGDQPRRHGRASVETGRSSRLPHDGDDLAPAGKAVTGVAASTASDVKSTAGSSSSPNRRFRSCTSGALLLASAYGWTTRELLNGEN